MKGIRLAPLNRELRRDLPARCDRCHATFRLTVREWKAVQEGALSHDCAHRLAGSISSIVHEPPEHGVRGRFVKLV